MRPLRFSRTHERAAPPDERLDDLLRIEAGLDGQHDALGHAQVGARQDDLVDGLGGLAGADGAHVRDGLCPSRPAPAAHARRPPPTPPTMIVRVPFCAPSEPPETGASTKRHAESRRGARRTRRWRLGADGRAVDDQAARPRRPRRRRPDRRARPPRPACRRRRGPRHPRRRPGRLGSAASVAPSARTERGAGRACGSRRSAAKPARARLAAIAAPMVPMPAEPDSLHRPSCLPCPVHSTPRRRCGRVGWASSSRTCEGPAGGGASSATAIVAGSAVALAAAAEDAEHEQEEVEEVEVERERAQDRGRLAC